MKNRKPQVTLNFTLPVSVKKKKKWTVVACPILDLVAQGDTEKEATNNLIKTATLFLLNCFERGTLDEVLKDCGLNPLHEGFRPVARRRRMPASMKQINVPLPFEVGQPPRQASCHA